MSLVDSYVRRETLTSVVINVVLSLVFFLLAFGTASPVPVRGAGGLAWLAGPESLGWAPALLLKLGYGGLLAAITTPPGLRAALRGDVLA